MALEATPRTTFILGAGASADAGLPTTIRLTEEITKAIDEDYRSGVAAQALHAVIGAMIAYDTGRESGVFDGINVERVFSAIQMLARRDELEIAPFVSAWNKNLEHFGSSPSLPPFWASNFRKEMQGSSFKDGLAQIFADGVSSLVGPSELGPVFKTLNKLMIGALGKALSVEDSRVDYLAPLLAHQEGPIQIATLNYDLCVELLSRRAGLSVDTGIQLWDGGYDWSWDPSAEVQLLKLHGSLDWYFDQRRVERECKLEDKVLRAADMTKAEISRFPDSLALVFGQTAKIRSEGPFLAMLLELEKFMLTTERLVIVGYSFGDEHINSAIRRWMRRSKSPKVSIINPAISEWTDTRNAPIFYREMLGVMHTRTHPRTLLEGNHILELAADPGLKEVVGSGPVLAEPFGDVVDPL
ncbi:MAG TPA: SIR2 family protein [Candidatus Nanopelagicaceae bacterium]|nr:SIR2 family protein [Candidatus Nanopelagicaceae bacterium]